MKRSTWGLILLLFSAPCFAVDNNAGTSGAAFLKIGAGARPTAMGDAFVAIADDVNALYFNPGGLALQEQKEFTALHTQYLQGLNYNFAALSIPTKNGGWGISGATLQTDDIDRRGSDESLTGSFQNQDAGYGLTYAHKIGEHSGWGGTLRWVRSEIDNASASSWSADLGIFKRFENNPLTLGLAVKHMGQKLKFIEESDPLPLTIDGGVGYRLFNDRFTMATNLKKSRDRNLEFGLGFEWQDAVADKVRYATRVGFNGANTDAEGANGITLGAGLGYRQMDFDFAWVPFGDLGNTFRYAAHFKF
ncbi:MAG: hypothetical protein KCHDKBKB_02210 [Elusimicrobia bacterium]|nr:hypothetical protein [Elusimicrobiota bacterium]